MLASSHTGKLHFRVRRGSLLDGSRVSICDLLAPCSSWPRRNREYVVDVVGVKLKASRPLWPPLDVVIEDRARLLVSAGSSGIEDDQVRESVKCTPCLSATNSIRGRLS